MLGRWNHDDDITQVHEVPCIWVPNFLKNQPHPLFSCTLFPYLASLCLPLTPHLSHSRLEDALSEELLATENRQSFFASPLSRFITKNTPCHMLALPLPSLRLHNCQLSPFTAPIPSHKTTTCTSPIHLLQSSKSSIQREPPKRRETTKKLHQRFSGGTFKLRWVFGCKNKFFGFLMWSLVSVGYSFVKPIPDQKSRNHELGLFFETINCHAIRWVVRPLLHFLKLSREDTRNLHFTFICVYITFIYIYVTFIYVYITFIHVYLCWVTLIYIYLHLDCVYLYCIYAI